MIYINGRFLTQNLTGVQRFAIELSKKLSKIRNDKVGYTLRMMLLISFFGAFVSMPELTNPIMWNLIFANIFYRSSAIADESKKELIK